MPEPCRIRRTVLAVAIGFLALTGCAEDAPVEGSLDTMVELEATWQCDVTRFSFAAPGMIDAKRTEIRERHGVSAEDHDVFVAMLEDDPALRAAVADRTDEMCPVNDA